MTRRFIFPTADALGPSDGQPGVDRGEPTRIRRAGGRAIALLLVVLSLPAVVHRANAAPSAPVADAPAVAQPAALPVDQLLADSGLADLLRLLLGPAPSASGILTPELESRVIASTVKVSSAACGLRLEGSGFSPAPDTVVTNAHVVAGAERVQVLTPDGRRLPAQVRVFDPDRDLAVLSVRGLGQEPLPVGSASVGSLGAVFGHPRGQIAVEASPARVARRITAQVNNIYGEGPVRRQILILASELEPGDSGAALVDQSGKVVGVAFAVSSLRRGLAFAVASEEVASVLAQPRASAVSTGRCIA